MSSPRDVIPLPLRLRLYDVRAAFDRPARRYPGLERAAPNGPRAVLTFDDGPDEDATPAVLDALDAARAHATFFLVGEQVERHPRIAADIAERGHEVALHAYRHARHASLSSGEADADLRRGLAVTQEVTGAPVRWYRPPFGRFSDESYATCRELGLEPAYWSHWGLDWEPIAPQRIAELACRGLAGGSVVLLHDSARYASRTSAGATAHAIAPIAARARAAGLELTTLSEAVT